MGDVAPSPLSSEGANLQDGACNLQLSSSSGANETPKESSTTPRLGAPMGFLDDDEIWTEFQRRQSTALSSTTPRPSVSLTTYTTDATGGTIQEEDSTLWARFGRGRRGSMLSRKRSEKRRGTAKPEFIARFYFANLTYISLHLSVDATAEDAIKILLDRLHISDSLEEYAIYEYYQDNGAEKEILLTSRLYDMMMTWSATQVFLFKRKVNNRRNLLRGQKNGDTQSFLEVTAVLNEAESFEDVVVNQTRRISKLASFFGLELDVGAAQTEEKVSKMSRKKKRKGSKLAGIEELLKLLNLVNLSGEKSGEEEVQPREEAQNLHKEGHLLLRTSENDSPSAGWISVWCVLEEGTLTLRSAKPDSESSLLHSIHIANSKVEIDVNSQKSKMVFNIAYISESSTHVITLAADGLMDFDAWMEALRHSGATILRVAPDDEKNAEKAEAPAGDRRMLMNDFEVHRVLGRGKYGTVMLCSQRSTNKVYAVKVIEKNVAQSSAGMDMMLETQILRSLHHPFIVSMHAAFQSPTRLYLIMDYINGGELFFHVANFGRFDEVRVRFYSAELLLAVQSLHALGIIYRDLKLENILLNRDGHVKIADFGLSRQEDTPEEEAAILGTLEYLAPEVLEGRGTSYASDWWAFGIVMFEMLCASHPFHSEDRMGIMKNILKAEICFPDFLSGPAHDVLTHLLNRTPKSRLGCGKHGSIEIQNHAFFQAIDFAALEALEVTPPYIPQVADDFDVSFFDETFTDAPIDPIEEDEDVESVTQDLLTL